jgi:hypothetical protein
VIIRNLNELTDDDKNGFLIINGPKCSSELESSGFKYLRSKFCMSPILIKVVPGLLIFYFLFKKTSGRWFKEACLGKNDGEQTYY